MYASDIHRYFTSIKLDPGVGWEILETAGYGNPANLADETILRRTLVNAISTYIDMAHDDEDVASINESLNYRNIARPLLMSNLRLTLMEQYTILGAAAWWGNGTIVDEVRDLVKRPVLNPQDA